MGRLAKQGKLAFHIKQILPQQRERRHIMCFCRGTSKLSLSHLRLHLDTLKINKTKPKGKKSPRLKGIKLKIKIKGKMTEIKNWISDKVNKGWSSWWGWGVGGERHKLPMPATKLRAMSIDLQQLKGPSYCVASANELDDRRKDKFTERHKWLKKKYNLNCSQFCKIFDLLLENFP